MTSVERAQDAGYGGGGQRTYRRDPKGTSTGGQFTRNPAGAQRTPLSYKGTQGAFPRPSGGGRGTPTAPSSSSRKFKTLAMDEDNDPAAVNELQRLLGALGIPIGFSGVYDDATVEAIKQVQRKLGIKNPNGRANKSLVDKMLAAYDLSPCLNPGP